MPRNARAIIAGAGESLASARRIVREKAPETLRWVAQPPFLEKHAGAATRTSQVMAFLVLGPLILVSLRILTALSEVFEAILGRGTFEAGTEWTDSVAWLITAVNLGAFILVAWVWFQFVRTSGFGMFSWQEGGQA